MNATKWLAVALLTMGAVAWAQDEPPGPPPGFGRGPGPGGGPGFGAEPGEWDKEGAKEMVETLMMARLSRELKLNDEETILMVRRVEEFKEKTAQLRKERGGLVKDLRDAVASGAPDADIEAKTKALIEADRKLSDARFGMFDEAKKGLSAVQSAKLYVFMSEFENQLRRLVQQARERVRGGREMMGPEGPEGPMPPPGDTIGPRRVRGAQDAPAAPWRQGGGRRGQRLGGPAAPDAPEGAPEPPPPPPPDTQ